MKTLIELFNNIWETREHVSELSGKPLVPKGHPQWHWQMMHVLSKGAYPKFKYNPDNILLGTIDEHTQQTMGWCDNELKNKFEAISDKLKQQYYEDINSL